jgi:filamentous hemagglutinin family protein
MNHAFRSIWNASKQVFVATAETVSTRGKPGSAARTLTPMAALVGGAISALAQAQTPPAAQALPAGGRVSAGQAAISQNGAQMLIQQSTNRAAINWQSFDVGRDAQVKFQQPGSDSVTLNRVMSSDPSQIFGRITANGQVILTNPAGVYFGRSARVDVGGLIATTQQISDADFMGGKNRFERQGGAGSVINEGELKAQLGGYIALLAPEVRNQGAVIAQKGTVVMAAGDAVDLHFDSNNRLTSIRVEPSQLQALVDNRHAVEAPGGLIILAAQSLDRLVGGVVRNSGRIEANALQQQGGRILLSASRTVEAQGVIRASGARTDTAAEGGRVDIQAIETAMVDAQIDVSGAQGGLVTVTADHIELQTAARIDASGSQVGGQVLVGGDWQGGANAQRRVLSDPNALRQASSVSMAAGATIDASATDRGQGGTVVLWSDALRPGTRTTVSGSILARGGASGGDGGQVETSGYVLNVEGARVNAGARSGQGGLWFLDPADATITQAVADSYRATLNTGTSVLNEVVGSITWNSGVTLQKTAGGDATLTLRAGGSNTHSIYLNTANISSTAGALNLVLWTRSTSSTVSGAITVLNSTISTNGGHMWMGGGLSASSPWNGLTVGNAGTLATAGTASLLVQGSQITTGAGHVYGSAQYSGASTSATAIGLLLNGSSITTTSGSVTLVGELLGSYSAGEGLSINNGSSITTGSGVMTLRGAASASNSPGGTVFAAEISNKVTLNTNSGDIKIYASSTANSLKGGGLAIWSAGTAGDGNQTSGLGNGYNVAVLSNSGQILLDGSALSTGSSGWSVAAQLLSHGSDKMLLKSTSGNITLKGSANSSRTDSTGLQFQVNTSTGRFEVISGSGDIYLQGFQVTRSTAANNNAMRFTPAALAGSIRIGAANDLASSYTGNVTLEADSIQNLGATTTLGSVKVIGAGALSFSSSGATSAKDFALTDNWDFGTGHSSVVIGKPTENKTITLSAPITAAGPITVYGGNLWLKDNLTSTQAGASIRLISSNRIYGDTIAKTISTNGGDVVLAADSDGSGVGNIDIYTGLTIDTRTIVSGSTKSTALTGGGHVTLGGGNATGSGYASGENNSAAAGIRIDNGFTIRSGGGNISLRGRSWAGAVSDGYGAWGVGVWGSGGQFVADAGAGKIYIEGISRSSGYGSVKQGFTVYGNTDFRSAFAGADAITIVGKNTTTGGVYNYGIGLNEYDTGGSASIVAGGIGGGITLDGYGNEWSLVARRPTSLITNGGPLNLLGSTRAGGSGAGLYLGSGSVGTWWVSSTNAAYSAYAKDGDLNIRFDRYSFNGVRPSIATSGDVVWTSFSDSFRSNVSTAWYSWNQNDQVMSSLTIGKPTNTASSVYINGSGGSASNAVTVAGPVTVHGRYIAVSSPLTVTNTGDITLRSLLQYAPSILITNVISKTGGDDATLTLRAPGRIDLRSNITASGAGTGKLNLVVWADDNADTKGGISISGDRTFSTNGGHVWFGGGRNAAQWNGLTVGDGAAGAGFDYISADLRGTFNTSGGDFYVAGKTNVNSSYRWDVNATIGNLAVNAGSGDVTFVGNRIDFGGVYTSVSRTTINTTGVLTIQPWDDSFGHTFTVQGALSGSNWVGVNTSGVTGTRGLTIQNAATLGGLVIGKNTNTRMVSVDSSLTIAGDINLYGGQVRNQSSATLTSTAGSILIDADLGRGVNFNGQGVNWTGGSLVASSNAAGQGSVTILARGGTKTTNNQGLDFNASISAGGDVSLTGWAMTNGSAGLKLAGTLTAGRTLNLEGRNLSSIDSSQYGVHLVAGASLNSTGSMTVTGHAGASIFSVALDNNVRLETTGSAGTSNIIVQALYGHVGSSAGAGSSVTNRLTAGAGSGITLRADRLNFAASKALLLSTTGTLTLEPAGSSFWLPLNWNGTLSAGHFVGGSGMLNNITLQNLADVGGLTLGKSGNNSNITFSSAADIKGPISAFGNFIVIQQALTSNRNTDTSKNRIVLEASGDVTQTVNGVLSAESLGLMGPGRFTLTNTSNNVAVLAAGTGLQAVRRLAYVDANDVAVGSVTAGSATASGILASGTVMVESLTGSIALNESISTSSTALDALLLNAGKSKAVAEGAAFFDGSGGNITVAAGRTVTVGSGGRATLYGGSVGGSAGLSTMVGSGSGRFRYASDEVTTNYLSPLDEGVYAIYRQQPTLTLKGIDESVVYGTESLRDVTATGLQNGDSVAQGMGKLPTVTLLSGGSPAVRNARGYFDVLRSGGNVVGYTMQLSTDAVSKLGYALAYDHTGQLTVTPKALTAVINDDAKFIGLADNPGYAGATFSGFVRGESATNISASTNISRTGMGASGGLGDALGSYNGVLTGTISLAAGNYILPTANITAGNFHIVDHNTLIVRVGSASAMYGNAATYDVSQVRYYNTVANAEVSLTQGSGEFNWNLGGNSGQAVDFSLASAGINVGTHGITGTVMTPHTLPNTGGNTTPSQLIAIGGRLTITPRTLTLSATKVYDGSDGLSGSQLTLGNLHNNETLTLSAAKLSDRNVVTANKFVRYAVLADGTGLVSNYQLPSLSVFDASDNTASVLARDLGISVTKEYDGQTSANAAQTRLTNLADGEGLTISGVTLGTARVAGPDGNVATADNFVSALSLSDKGPFLSSNYVQPVLGASGAGNRVTINPKELSINGISATGTSKVYDGTEAAGSTFSATVSLDGLLAGESASITVNTANYNSKNVRDANQIALGSVSLGAIAGSTVGTVSSDYTVDLSAAFVEGSITPRNISVAASANPVKVYDGTSGVDGATVAMAAATSTTGKVGSDDVRIVGVGGDYHVAGNTSSLLVDAGSSRSYTLADITLSGADKDNYSLTSGTISGTDGVIAPRPLTLTASKVYDGTTSLGTRTVTITNEDGSETAEKSFGILTLGNLVQGENLAISAVTGSSARVAGPDGNVSTADNFIRTITLTNDDVFKTSNYSLPGSSTGVVSGVVNTLNAHVNNTVTITPATLTVGLQETQVSKTYDRLATFNTYAPTYTVQGFVDGDTDATLTQTGRNFNAATVAGATTFTVSGVSISTITGTVSSAASDYALNVNTLSVAGSISPRPVAVDLSAGVKKIYDSTTSFNNLNVALGSVRDESDAVVAGTGVVSGDVVSVSASGGGFDDKRAGSGKSFTLTGLTLTGADSGNYSLGSGDSISGVSGTIDPKTIYVTGLTIAARQYDGTTTATYSGTAALLPTVAAGGNTSTDGKVYIGDTVNLSGSISTALFDSKNVQAATRVNLGGLSLSGTDADNYTLEAFSSATIAPKTLTAAPAFSSKTYDATTGITVSSVTLNGFVGSETVSAAGTASLDSANAGSRTATVSYTLADGSGGGLASNYSLADSTHTVSVAKKSLTVTGSSATGKTYNGLNTAAVTVGSLSGLIGSETVTATASGTFDSANAGSRTVTVVYSLADGSSGGLASNYSLANTTHSATIAAKALSISGTVVAGKVYDGTNTASVTSAGTLSGLISGEMLSVTASATFNLSTAGAGRNASVSFVLADGTGLAANYSLASVTKTGLTISQKALNLSGLAAANKVYDGTSSASVVSVSSTPQWGSLSGVVTGDSVSLVTTGYTAAFNDRNVGNGKTVTFSGLSLNGTAAANYTIGQQTSTADITKATLTLSGITAANRVYDGSTAATVDTTGLTVTGLVSVSGTPDDVTVSSVTGLFDSKNVGNTKTVNLTETLTGSDLANYTVIKQGTATANITRATLTLSGSTGVSKIYDGTTRMASGLAGYMTAGAGSLTGILSGDSVSVSGSAEFVSANVARVGNVPAGAVTTQAINQGTVTLAGADAGNYNLVWTNGSGTINPAALTIRANDDARFLTQSDAVNFAGVSFSGFVNGETSAVLGGAAAVSRSNAGTGTAGHYAGVLQAGGLSSSNYTISYVAGDYTIVPSNQLLVRVTPVSNAYGTATQYAVSRVEYESGGTVYRLDDNSVSGSSVAVGSGNVVTVNDGSSGTASFTVLPKTVSGDFSTAGKLKVGAYQLGVAGLVTENSANFSDTVTVVGSHQVSTKGLTASATGVSKVYDGTTSMSGVSLGLSTLETNDVVTVNGLGAFGSRNAGTNINYTISGLNLSGDDAANYHLSGGASFSGNDAQILAKSLTVSGLTAAHKIYNASTAVVISGSAALTDGAASSSDGKFYAGDVVSIAGTPSGSFANKNVGTGKTVTVGGLSLSGADAGNYTLSAVTTNADITAKTLTVGGLSAVHKVYDGATLATLAGTPALQTALAPGAGTGNDGAPYTGDTVVLAGTAAGNFVDKHVGTGKSVGVTGLSLTGTDAALGNYTLGPISTSANITAKALSISGLSSANKVYDGTNAAMVTGTATLQALIAVGAGTSADGRAYVGDTVSLTGSAVGVFNSKDVAAATGVSFSGFSLTGADATNYTLTPHASASQSISPKALTVSGLSSANKTYDATVTAAVVGTASLQASIAAGSGTSIDGKPYSGDTVSLTGSPTASFNSKQVAAATTVSFSGLSLAGGDAGNYSLTPHANASHSITPKSLTVSGLTSANKVYDGNATASISGTAALQTAIAAGTGTPGDGKAYTGDAVILAGTASAAFNSKNVADALTVSFTGLSLAGIDSANYALPPHATATHSVTAKALAIAGTLAQNKIYDRNANAAITLGVLSGFVGSETVTASATGVFDSASAGSRTATATYTLADGSHGGLASNYTLADTTGLAATISPKVLTISGVSASNKVYDGNATASLSGGFLIGVLGADTVTLTLGNAAFDSKNVGSGKAVTVGGSSLVGPASGNYSLTEPVGLAADITRRTVSLSGIKTYDGTTDLAGAVTISTGVGSETLTYTGAAANSKHVAASGNFISALNLGDAIDGSGGQAGNYQLPDMTTAAAGVNTVTINPAVLSPTLTNSGVTKAYDGTTHAPAGFTPSYSLSGLVSGDTAVVLTPTGASYDNANVANAATLTLTGIGIGTVTGTNGSQPSDYVLDSSSKSVPATISRAALTIRANDDARFLTQSDAVNFAGVSFSGFVNGETSAVLGGVRPR